ncbi:adhesion G protein-coupled receptor F5 isoform X2 [Esox lucius]|uniref:adhesion G protein-coupled receptor F5 isoform X2 n=1 Tax=Esox lucius TaxID=8010 RepID=UPI0009734C74|nr:adhesion G protein-coupled receptor F5 isoform X2 [Esox lucius]
METRIGYSANISVETSGNNTYVLNNGTSITITSTAACTTVQINSLSGMWAEGIYKCGFSSGSIVHAATAELKVALLPDTISMTSDPLTVECPKDVMVNATIQNSPENYTVTWTLNQVPVTSQTPSVQTDGQITYRLNSKITCQQPSTNAIIITVNFMNQKNKNKTQNIIIPVIDDNVQVCQEDSPWPKTPKGFTLVIQQCEIGRVGYQERTCISPEWMNELDRCVSEELNNVLNTAAAFRGGLGVTQKVALAIFSSLKNISNDTSYSNADLSASIGVLDIMFEASKQFTLDESVLGDFLGAASNMLNANWEQVNTTISYQMSSLYLKSVEGLVENIYMNNSDGYSTQNLEFKLCKNITCNQTVFGVEVNLNQSSGIVKTLGVKNLSDKLNNENFPVSIFPSIVVSATLQNRTDSNIDIKLDFPINQPVAKGSTIQCVFWNTTLNEWSEDGCMWKEMVNNRSYCECSHLTSFSVLMSTSQPNLPYLDEITYVGLGVSIGSLLIFLLIEALVWSAVVKSKLSHFRHMALVNISLCLLLADCSFLASSSSNILPTTWCLVLTLAKQFFFQAMFCWMLCLSIVLLHQLVFVFYPLRKRLYLFLSIVLGYVCPTLIVASTFAYYRNERYYDVDTCWLVYTSPLKGSMNAFFLPVGTIVLMNMFSMYVVIQTLFKSSFSNGSKADEKETVKSILKVVVFLTPVLGVTWGLGFFTQIWDSREPVGAFMVYAFTITNSFQGLFILLTGCFAEKKVRDEVWKIIMTGAPPPKGKTESMKNLTKSALKK